MIALTIILGETVLPAPKNGVTVLLAVALYCGKALANVADAPTLVVPAAAAVAEAATEDGLPPARPTTDVLPAPAWVTNWT